MDKGEKNKKIHEGSIGKALKKDEKTRKSMKGA